MKLIPNNITLENVKKSNYWDLIANTIWNHYSEKKRQDESMITIKEKWYGKAIYGSSHNNSWDDESYKESGYTRTLQCIELIFKRSDYTVYFLISCENGNIQVISHYNDKEFKTTPSFYLRNVDMTNWMLENQLLSLTTNIN